MMTDDRRLTAVENAVQDIRDAVGQIAEAMTKIARLEERHAETRDALARAFSQIHALREDTDDHKVRFAVLEGQIEPLKEARKWVVSGVMAVVSLVGTAAWHLVAK